MAGGHLLNETYTYNASEGISSLGVSLGLEAMLAFGESELQLSGKNPVPGNSAINVRRPQAKLKVSFIYIYILRSFGKTKTVIRDLVS